MRDDELIGRILEGEADAFNEFCERFRRLVWALTTRILVNHTSEWDDAQQEVWLRVWHKLADWRGGSLKSWVGRVAANRLCDILRQLRRNPPPASLPPDVGETVTDEERDNAANRKDDIERIIRSAATTLPDKERRLVMMLLEGKKAMQICDELDMSRAAFYLLKATIFGKFKDM